MIDIIYIFFPIFIFIFSIISIIIIYLLTNNYNNYDCKQGKQDILLATSSASVAKVTIMPIKKKYFLNIKNMNAISIIMLILSTINMYSIFYNVDIILEGFLLNNKIILMINIISIVIFLLIISA